MYKYSVKEWGTAKAAATKLAKSMYDRKKNPVMYGDVYDAFLSGWLTADQSIKVPPEKTQRELCEADHAEWHQRRGWDADCGKKKK